MSQAKGRAVDRRAEVWAFGVVLFEMLTGSRAFEGEGISETLARVLEREPDWSRCAPRTRGRIRDGCVTGDPDDDRIITRTTALDSRLRRRSGADRGTGGAGPALHASDAAPELGLDITTPATDAPLQFALSPDGRSLVFVASGDGSPRLWLRPLYQTEARPLSGTEGAAYPFWSPDSRSIGFLRPARSLRIDVAGGAAQVLAAANGIARSGSCSADGTTLYAQRTNSPLFRVAAAGGEPVAVTRLDPPRLAGHRGELVRGVRGESADGPIGRPPRVSCPTVPLVGLHGMWHGRPSGR